jgi:two-component system phosphate regulon response regulator PhoB
MSRGAKVLLVEDDPALAELLEFRFRTEGYDVRATSDGDEALLLAEEELPDLVVLDWMIEGTSGIEVCRRLRRDKQTAHVPIIMLTAREAEDDRVRGLETGADDYLTKPFSPRELMARVSAIMRRIRPALAGETITVGDLSLDATAHRVTRCGQTIALGPTEFRLLKFFMEHPGRVFAREQLLDAVWGIDSDIELRTVDVHIRRLRKGIEVEGAADPVRTVRSAGYALEAV